MSVTAVRQTIYGYISAIERDVRSILLRAAPHDAAIAQVLDKETFERADERFRKELGATAYVRGLSEILPYIDFGDAIQLVRRNKNLLDARASLGFDKILQQLLALIPIRNRVMHSRPLDPDDLPQVLDAVEACLKCRAIEWTELDQFRTRLKNAPSSIFGVTIPVTEERRTPNNLPLPDFDETGYIGRIEDEKALRRLISGPYPVVTVVGEGGLGKTALVQKVVFNLIDDEPDRFDVVVWSSSRTSNVGLTEILAVKDSINTSLGLFRAIEQQLSGNSSTEPLSEILQYLEQFKVLLILDNLETIKDEAIEAFFDKLPPGCKVLVTSRVGLGQFERRLNLKPLEPKDSVNLLRRLRKARGLEGGLPADETALIDYAARLNHNPGFIKWFVSGIQTGLRPLDIFNNSGLFLDFCMDNIYRFLSADSKLVVSCIQCAQLELSQSELAYLSELDPVRLQEAINQLITTNILKLAISRQGAASDIRYNLGDIARDYLALRSRPDPAFYKKIRGSVKELRDELNASSLGKRRFRYAYEAIEVRSVPEMVIAKKLSVALRDSSAARYSAALSLVDHCRLLEPGYYEVHRIAAQINCAAGQYMVADECYQAALRLNSQSSTLHYWYGAFLARYVLDYEKSLKHLDQAEALDSSEPVVKIEAARVLMYLQRYDLCDARLEPVFTVRLHRTSLSKAWDLAVRNAIRRCQSISGVGCPEFEISLTKLLDRLMAVPPEAVDDGVTETIARAYKYLIRVQRAAEGSRIERQIIESLNAWQVRNPRIAEEIERPDMDTTRRGVVVRTYDGFGYIVGENGVEYYFNERSVKGRVSNIRVLLDTEVLFRVGQNFEGECAVNVRIAGAALGDTP